MVECATLVGIHLIENGSQVRKIVLRHLLDEQLNGSLSELATSMESGQTLHDSLLHCTFNFRCLVCVLEPMVLHRINGRYSFGWVLLEHLPD